MLKNGYIYLSYFILCGFLSSTILFGIKKHFRNFHINGELMCIIWLLISLCFHPFMKIFEYHIHESKEEKELIKSYDIIKGNTRSQLKGDGFGLLTYYQMSITSNDEFIFYFINNDQEIERKVVDLNFKIKEMSCYTIGFALNNIGHQESCVHHEAWDRGEIIGNIYENPELLEEEK